MHALDTGSKSRHSAWWHAVQRQANADLNEIGLFLTIILEHAVGSGGRNEENGLEGDFALGNEVRLGQWLLRVLYTRKE